ncbi:ATP-grasp domain-containing protein [Viscerimonas tarda]
MNKMNILITSAGQRVSLVRAFQKELRNDKLGLVFTTDLNPKLSAACNISDKYFQVSRVTSSTYIEEVLTICQENNIGMIIPTIDTELQILSDNKDLFEDNNIKVIISSHKFIQTCRDKRITNNFFLEHGVNIPRPINKENPTFPIFIKPYDGSLSSDIFIINTKEELLDKFLNNEKFMFMEVIDKNEYSEYTVDMYYGKDNRVKSIIPRKRITVRAGEIQKGITCKNEIVNYLKRKFEYIDGAIGCITLQLFYSDETKDIIGIEINPRFGGGFPLSYAAKGNYPKWLIEEYFLNESINYFEGWENNLLMLRYDDEVLIHDYRD